MHESLPFSASVYYIKLIISYLSLIDLIQVGCTNMRRFLFVMQGVIPKESITWKGVSEEKYLKPGTRIVRHYLGGFLSGP